MQDDVDGRPGAWVSWLVCLVGIVCLWSAFAFRHRLEGEDVVGAGESVPVGPLTLWWLQLHKVPLAGLDVGAVLWRVSRLLSR